MKFLLASTLLLIGCLLMAAFLLGASGLDQDLPFGLNAGVAAAALALVLAAVGPAWLAGPGARFRADSRIALVAAVACLPVSMALAGGAQLRYSGWRSGAWLVFTAFVLLSLLASWGLLLLAQARRAATAA